MSFPRKWESFFSFLNAGSVRRDLSSAATVRIDYLYAVTQTLKVIVFATRRASLRQNCREALIITDSQMIMEELFRTKLADFVTDIEKDAILLLLHRYLAVFQVQDFLGGMRHKISIV